ncbi:DUF4411 family protein [Geodermatophilus sp. CPCC 205506]|uniref:DUF4411 family protein n=1 Tax=Geodermatophilus sp. CPCC 205506 TaxID=2936596 RepID=UPI003EE9579C
MTFYSFDTSAFINGRRDLLRPTVFQTLWKRIEEEIVAGSIRCPDLVRDEISRREDEVHEWVKAQVGLFVPLEEDIQRATRHVLSIAPRLVGRGGKRNMADPFVVALAMARDGVVVTEETRSGSIEKPRIPDACEALGIRWLPLMGYIEEQGWTF